MYHQGIQYSFFYVFNLFYMIAYKRESDKKLIEKEEGNKTLIRLNSYVSYKDYSVSKFV